MQGDKNTKLAYVRKKLAYAKIRIRPLTPWILICVGSLTRARVAVSSTFAMVGGQYAPQLTRKRNGLGGRVTRRLKALSERVRSYFGHFFAQVNIEVTRGHQKQNFPKISELHDMASYYDMTWHPVCCEWRPWGVGKCGRHMKQNFIVWWLKCAVKFVNGSTHLHTTC